MSVFGNVIRRADGKDEREEDKLLLYGKEFRSWQETFTSKKYSDISYVIGTDGYFPYIELNIKDFPGQLKNEIVSIKMKDASGDEREVNVGFKYLVANYNTKKDYVSVRIGGNKNGHKKHSLGSLKMDAEFYIDQLMHGNYEITDECIW